MTWLSEAPTLEACKVANAALGYPDNSPLAYHGYWTHPNWDAERGLQEAILCPADAVVARAYTLQSDPWDGQWAKVRNQLIAMMDIEPIRAGDSWPGNPICAECGSRLA